MAKTFEPLTGNGVASRAFLFPSIKEADIKVEVDGTAYENRGISGASASATTFTITSYNASSGGNVVFDTAPASPASIHIYRDTDVDTPRATFTAGSSIKAGELNNNMTQVLYATQEEQNQLIKTSDIKDSQITTAKIKADNITSALIADDQINSEHYVAGSIDLEHMSANSVDSDQYVDGSIDLIHMSANSVDSDQYVDGSIDLVHMSANSVDSDQYVDGSIDSVHLANSAVGSNQIAANAVTTTEILNGAVTSAKILDGTIVNADVNASAAIAGTKVTPSFGSQNVSTSGTAATGALTVTGNIAVSGTVDGRDVAADGTKLDGIETAATADQTAAEIKTLLQSNKLTASEIANDAVTADKIADAVIVTNSEQASASVNDTTFFTTSASDARYFNISSGDTIKNGDTFPDNDTTIATTAAINDRIIDIVDDIGGFVPLVDEGEIPQYHPEKENAVTSDRVGTILSIGTLTTTYTPSGGTVTIQASDLTNHSVNATITDCGSTVLTSGFGVLVETKAQTDSQYAAGPSFKFHRLVPKATEVTTVAGISSNITTVANNTANINAVAADASDIGIVAADGTDIGLVAGSIANVNTTAGSIANVNTTAGSITNVNNVGNNISNVNSVAGNSSNINSAVSNASNINSAVSNASNINTVAGAISNVNTTATNIASVNTTASNIANVNNFTDKYQIASNNPSTDGGGNALAAGDLYFNTSANELKVYNGSSWQGGVTASGSFAATTGNTFTGDNLYSDGVKALFGTGSDLQIFHNGSLSAIQSANVNNLTLRQQYGGGYLFIHGDNIHLRSQTTNELYFQGVNNGAVELYYDASPKITTTSTGAKVTGEILAEHSGGIIQTLQATTGAQSYLKFINSDTGNGTFTDGLLVGLDNDETAAFWLYENKNMRFATNGVERFKIEAGGDIKVTGDKAIFFGASDDLMVGHDGSSTRIEDSFGYLTIKSDALELRSKTGSELYTKNTYNGAVELYYNNAKKFETNSVGTLTTGTSKVAAHAALNSAAGYNGQNFSFLVSYLGGNDTNDEGNGICFAQQYASSDASSTVRTGAIIGYKSVANGSFGGGLQFKVQQAGATALLAALKMDHQGTLYMPHDNQALKIGAGQDLQIYHDGSHSKLVNSTGDLHLASNNAVKILGGSDLAEVLAVFNDNGAVELYHDNNKKFETTSIGVDVTGNLIADCTTAIDPDANLNSFMTGGIQDGSGWGVNGIAFGAGTGHMAAMGSNNQNLYFAYGDGSNANSLTTYSVVTPAGAVELNYNGNKKFETTSNGIKVTKLDVNSVNADINLTSGQNSYTRYGSINHYHNNSTSEPHNQIKLTPRNGSNGRIYIKNMVGGTLATKLMIDAVDGIVNYDHSIPATDSTYNLGSSSARFANAYVDTYYGDGSNLTGISSVGGATGVTFNDSVSAQFGTGGDLDIFHTGSHGYIDNGTGNLYIRGGSDDIHIQPVSGEEGIIVMPNGQVKLYNDNSLRLQTESWGVRVKAAGADVLIQAEAEENRSAELRLISDEGDDNGDYTRIRKDKDTNALMIQDYGAGSWQSNIVCLNNDSTELYFGGTLKFKTGVGGDYGSVVATNGTNGWSGYSINNQWVFMGDSGSTGLYNDMDNEWFLYAARNGGLSLYYNGTAKLATESAGISVSGEGKFTGHVYPSANNSYDLGTSTNRWRNVYTNDLHLSNEGHTNDVDGTWGNWTIQEGESDLFLKNNRSGKKYKFNLTEVS